MWDGPTPHTPTVNSQDCAAADEIWATDWESDEPCDWPDPPPPCADPGGEPWGWPGQSPILVDLDRNGFELTGLDDAVLFDLNADGALDIVGWTSPNGRDAFVWLDRNSNGLVDDGSELFGDNTPLGSEGDTARHGYEALRELDKPDFGGNGDGYLDAGDAAFRRLMLWVDSNHDGISGSDEITRLADSNVFRLNLGYRMVIEIDSHGNVYKYLSEAWLNEGDSVQSILTTDVFFVAQGFNPTGETHASRWI